MCNSFNNSIPPFFNYKSQRFEFKGISLHIKWCLKALFANWLNKILKIRSVTCTVNVPNILFNDYSYNNRNFTGDFNFCFFNWFVIFSTGSIFQRYWQVNFLRGEVSKRWADGEEGPKGRQLSCEMDIVVFCGLCLIFLLFLSFFFPFVKIVVCLNVKENQ